MASDRSALPDGLLVAWYGDDFTGSSATMEAMEFAGLPSVLFLGPPDAEMLARFSGYRGIGIAGVARAKSPEWMKRELPPIFDRIASLAAPITHYKICSTLDSAPHVGSIGCAIDLAAPVLGGKWHPLVVAAPAIGRYQAFGNLFAASSGTVYRLDRHPTMSRHPVTPMAEADVRLHLSCQTERSMGLIDLLALRQPGTAERALDAAVQQGAEVVALDVVTEQDLAAVGQLIWQHRGDRLFAIGSQGLEYALIAHWRATGAIPPAQPAPSAGAIERIVVVSGSCAPDTAVQIAWAGDHGFRLIRAKTTYAVDEGAWANEIERLRQEALRAIDEGFDPLVFTASGPDDRSIPELRNAIQASGGSEEDINERIGTGLGSVLGQTLAAAGLKRGVIAGGDTSGYGAMALGIEALTTLAPTVPGAALFKAHARNPALGEMEIALKGGQMGTPDYFEWIKTGGGPSRERSKGR